MASSQYDQTHGKSKRSKRGNRHPETFDWREVSNELLRDAIEYVSRSGGALRFGLTRDQGACAIGIYGEGDPYTEYLHNPDDCTEFLRELIDDYKGDALAELKKGL